LFAEDSNKNFDDHYDLLLIFLGLKAGLHYGDYRSKLVHFEAQKNIFHIKFLRA
jgi:hypothetical protein